MNGRENLISEKNRPRLEKYICGIITKRNCKPLAIYCNPDHCHILIGLDPKLAISDLVRDIKAFSSKLINEERWIKGKFEWQAGYGVFSHSRSQLDTVVKYILRQPEHHGKKTFRQEYLELLRKFEVGYDEKYLFDFMD